MKVEILAPAGSFENLKSAVFGGADGIYLGTKDFSARQSATNFTFAELEEAVEFCHVRNVNVYVAVNTLVKNSELDKVISLATELARINVDGVIVQDLAVAKIFRRVCPAMPLHASTQMAIHNLSGAKLLKELGFTRVVLARELDLDEIKEITAKCGLETEVFVHGAHCMSASGMCYLSSFIGGRSGNRGRCAQPCRLDFKSGNSNYCLSLKDMCYIDYVKELEKAGVTSLKIEGRMKRPEYSYIASNTYKKALCGENVSNEVKLFQGVFSRSGFTDGYISGRRNKEMFGYRKKEDVEASTEAIKSIGKIEETQKISVDVTVDIRENEPLKLTFASKNCSVSVESENEITVQTLLPSVERMEESLRKTGGTPFVVENINIRINLNNKDTTNAFPISAINSLRRCGLEKLSQKLAQRAEKEIKNYTLPATSFRNSGSFEYRIRVEKVEQIGDFCGKVIIPYTEASKIEQLFNEAERESFILELPILVYPKDEDKVLYQLRELRKKSFSNVLCENIAFVSKLKEMGFKVHGGAYLNIVNPVSMNEYRKLGVCDFTLSLEINSGDIRNFGTNDMVGIITYGFMPVMHFRNCPIRASFGCDKCGGKGFITDRLSKRFGVLCKGKKYVSMLNTVPLAVLDKSMKVDFQTLYFTNESPDTVKKIISQFASDISPDYAHTKGLYFRKVL